MATAVLPNLRPASLVRSRINAAASAADDQSRRKTSSPNWWSPVFGFSSDPDYLNQDDGEGKRTGDSRSARSRFAPGMFTEEKARQLRRMNGGTASFHDSMYHSAIASRLASEFSDRTADDVV